MSAMLLSLGGLVLFTMQKVQTQPRIELPAPTGPFAVGTAEYHLIVKSRKETKSSNPDYSRELMIHVWYPCFANSTKVGPTDKRVSGEPDPYLDKVMPHVKKIIYETTDTPSLEQLNYLDAPIKTHSFYNAPISQAQPEYPVVIFSHGLGSGAAQLYTSILEDLASHGYIVVAIDHTYDNLVTIFPGNRVVKFEIPEGEGGKVLECTSDAMKQETEHLNVWVHDIQFVLDELEKINKHDPNGLLTAKFDLSRIGVFGHSFGGAAATQACRIDIRCKAGADIDGALQGKDAEKAFNKPFMIVLAKKFVHPSNKMLAQVHMTKSEYDTLCAAGYLEQHMPPINNLFNNLTNDTYLVFFKNAHHMSFSDYPILFPTLAPDAIAPLKGIEITRKLVVDFFDVYLKNKNRSQFIEMMEHMPELQVKIKTKIEEL